MPIGDRDTRTARPFFQHRAVKLFEPVARLENNRFAGLTTVRGDNPTTEVETDCTDLQLNMPRYGFSTSGLTSE